MPLQVYSTLTRKKEPFPKKPGEPVTMYVCGPTVYKPSHIGHMVGPVIFDTVKRYLTYLGYKVTWVVNITDVDDKLIVRAKELGTTVKDLAEKMTADYFDCLKKLNVTGIDHFPRATEYIPQMIAMMERLIAKGYAYAAGGDVYFDISRDEDYGKLCNRDPEQLEAGSRIEVTDKKKNPGDFALWKSSKPGEPAWDSPWGRGRPGWHIECSAMAQALLGKTIDIHGGGLDLQFPHHENELAQSESDTGETFARVWMHNGLLKMGSAKMAGSVGNVVNIADLLSRHSAETVRFLLLSTHYRSPIEYSDDRLDETKDSLSRFHRFFERVTRVLGLDFYTMEAPQGKDWKPKWEPPSPEIAAHPSDKQIDKVVIGFRDKFFECMDDDLNTGGAVGVVFSLLNYLNWFADVAAPKPIESIKASDSRNFRTGVVVLRELSSILGLFWQPPAKTHLIKVTDSVRVTDTVTAVVTKASDSALADAQQMLEGLVKLLIDLRNNLRTEAKKIAAKDDPTRKALFEQTDVIRKRLSELGITLEDRPGGTDWRIG